MKKKHVFTIITCILIAAAGICYSVSYMGRKETPVITTLASTSADGNAVSLISEDPGADKTGEAKSAAQLPVDTSGNTAASGIQQQADTSQPASDGDNKDMIYIHLCGEVAKPDVYKVESGSRLVDVIDLAGGLTKEAAGDYINQAAEVTDGQRIYVPSKAEVKELNPAEYISDSGSNTQAQSDAEKLVNINTADAEELMSLPGIGQAKASGIIKYRDENGKFNKTEELMNIPGIKEGLFGQISSYITVK